MVELLIYKDRWFWCNFGWLDRVAVTLYSPPRHRCSEVLCLKSVGYLYLWRTEARIGILWSTTFHAPSSEFKTSGVLPNTHFFDPSFWRRNWVAQGYYWLRLILGGFGAEDATFFRWYPFPSCFTSTHIDKGLTNHTGSRSTESLAFILMFIGLAPSCGHQRGKG